MQNLRQCNSRKVVSKTENIHWCRANKTASKWREARTEYSHHDTLPSKISSFQNECFFFRFQLQRFPLLYFSSVVEVAFLSRSSTSMSLLLPKRRSKIRIPFLHSTPSTQKRSCILIYENDFKREK